jgi:hypothetical protein
MADSPPDKVANVDVTTLSQHDASEFRRELLHAIWHPGIEFDEWDNETLLVYKNKVDELNTYLATFPEKT